MENPITCLVRGLAMSIRLKISLLIQKQLAVISRSKSICTLTMLRLIIQCIASPFNFKVCNNMTQHKDSSPQQALARPCSVPNVHSKLFFYLWTKDRLTSWGLSMMHRNSQRLPCPHIGRGDMNLTSLSLMSLDQRQTYQLGSIYDAPTLSRRVHISDGGT